MEGAEGREANTETVDPPVEQPRGPVRSLREAWENRRVLRSEWRFPTWPRRWPIRWFRFLVQNLLIIPLLRIAYSIEVRGRENVAAVQQPCLVISNHNMHMDAGILMIAVRLRFRRKVAIAAATQDIYGNRFRGFLSSLLGNAFPFAKEGAGIRGSLEYVFKMLDDGWNVFIFPEGKLTVLGPTQRFKSGVGRLAMDTGVPVLPMRIDVLRPGFFEGKWLPHPRARVRVSIGEPVVCGPGLTSAEATRLLEAAVRDA